ncbi:MAG: thiamine-phosphate kinase [Hyphomonadaceae bacterium]
MSAEEFDVIRTLFAPLATSEGARGLADDAAVLDVRGKLVVTTDALVEGVHFLSHDPIETVAMKAVRVNVSDIIAKGAQPVAALLTLVWRNSRDAEEIARFATAFGAELRSFGISLLGGDTTSTPGPLTVSVTLFGAPLGGRTPARADARVGEDLWLVGGEIGSAWLGLQLRSGEMKLDRLRQGRNEIEADALNRQMAQGMPDYLTLPGETFDAEAAWLMTAYLAPFVRAECASLVAEVASAALDVSDGLIADAEKLAAASGVALTIEAARAPLSIPAQRWVDTGGDLGKLLCGGDDYVVLFTAPEALRFSLETADGAGALRLTRIGRVETGEGVRVLDANGAKLQFAAPGYSHKLGR